MHFVPPPFPTFPPPPPPSLLTRFRHSWLKVLVPPASLSSHLPLCFLLQPPSGFLLIPIYSIFYKSL